jgi:hypothetical protein
MALNGRSNDSGREVAREFAMRDSSPSAVLLPFGSLTGIIPVDAVPRGRVLGDASSVIAGSHRPPSELQRQIHSLIDPHHVTVVGATNEQEWAAG